jgi:hypothetical protein
MLTVLSQTGKPWQPGGVSTNSGCATIVIVTAALYTP